MTETREGLAIKFVHDFVREWEATWVDPEDVNHEWAKLYRTAKALIGEPLGKPAAEEASNA